MSLVSSVEQGSEFSIGPEDLWADVLNYPFPEVRALLNSLLLPQEFFMHLTPDEVTRMLQDNKFDFDPVIQFDTKKGYVDRDRMHVPVLDRIYDLHHKDQLPGLSTYKHRYATQGSTQAIRVLMPEWKAKGEMTELAVIGENGREIGDEYMGYQAVADSFNIPVLRVPTLAEAGEPVKGRVWFISNPSALDGNWLNDEALQAFIAAGHEVVLDLAYGGLAIDPHVLDVSAPNIRAVLTSPSKIFGVFWQRYMGVAYTREKVSSLEWDAVMFKEIPTLLATLILYKTFKPNELPRKYQQRQLDACAAIARLLGMSTEAIVPSDTLLMATTAEPLPDEYSEYLQFTLPSGISRFRLPGILEKQELHKLGRELWYPPAAR